MADTNDDTGAKMLPPPHGSHHRILKPVVITVLVLVIAYVAVAYLLLPSLWHRYTRKHPSFDDIPNITHAKDGVAGDPLNVALIGSETELKTIMLDAGWFPADPLTLKSCWEIASATIRKRPYDKAPVSNLFLYGRKEDLAFEKPVGDDPRHRHHVRLWRTDKQDTDGRPIWIGAAIYDERVGLSRTTGQITHVTAPDIDAERGVLFTDVEKTGDLEETYFIDGFHKVLKGKNGGGDPWFTDGRLEVGVIKPA